MDAARYRELARAAFPDGFLAVRGVLTVGGWTCMEAEWCEGGDVPGYMTRWQAGDARFVWPYYVHEPSRDKCPEVLRRTEAEATRAQGDLLPDYADQLTRLAILIELAKLCGEFSYPPAFVGDILPIDLVPLCATDDGEIEAVFVALARLRGRAFPLEALGPRSAEAEALDYSPDEEISDHGLNG